MEKEFYSVVKLVFVANLALWVGFPLLSFAQLGNGLKTGLDTTRPAYLDLEAGIQYSTFRDFATSPLFYVGHPFYVSIAHLDMDARRESSIRFAHSFGNFKSQLKGDHAVSKVNTFMADYIELFKLQNLCSQKLNIKLGGQFNTIVVIRDNESLGNNKDGFEVISTLAAAIKGNLDISKSRDYLKRNLTFGVQVGVFNTSYRNGFIYTRHSPLLNKDDINNGYEFHFFSGFRMNSFVGYHYWLKNGNALLLSYLWDAYKTGSNPDQFEMANHLLKLALFFKLK